MRGISEVRAAGSRSHRGLQSLTGECLPERAAVGDIEIAYAVRGSGYPLLLIIGMGGSGSMWDPAFVEGLSGGFRVIAFDGRGMGETPSGEEEFTIERFAADAAGLLRAIDVERAHVLGYSMGGYVAQELALTYPGMVGKLVLLDTESGNEKGTCIARDTLDRLADVSGSAADREERLIGLLYPRAWLDEHSDGLHETFSRLAACPPDPLAAMRQVEAMCRWKGAEGRLPSMGRPVLVIAGKEDEVITPQHSRKLAGLIPGAELVEVEGAGHGIIYQFPAELADIVRGFLERD